MPAFAPQDNERSVITPSVWQVRQPVYHRTSVDRWKRYQGPARPDRSPSLEIPGDVVSPKNAKTRKGGVFASAIGLLRRPGCESVPSRFSFANLCGLFARNTPGISAEKKACLDNIEARHIL